MPLRLLAFEVAELPRRRRGIFARLVLALLAR